MSPWINGPSMPRIGAEWAQEGPIDPQKHQRPPRKERRAGIGPEWAQNEYGSTSTVFGTRNPPP